MSDTDNLVKAGAIIAGIGLILGLIKLLGEKRYRCPVCNNEIAEGTNSCPYCNSYLRWDK